jgi:hypothetical protein
VYDRVPCQPVPRANHSPSARLAGLTPPLSRERHDYRAPATQPFLATRPPGDRWQDLFEIVGAILNIETIAEGRGIRELKRLWRKHGKGQWRKKKGFARVRLEDGSVHTAEIHWYEAHGIGRKEAKLKRIIR